MIASVQGRIGLLCLTFFLLASVSVATTAWILETEKADAQVINLAGRQRMLVEQITNHVLWLDKQPPNEAARHKLSLQQSIITFEQTLQALTYGGQAPNAPSDTAPIPATQQPELKAGLDRVAQTWQNLRRHLDIVINSNPNDPQFTTATQAIYQTGPRLVQQIDDVVNLYQADSTEKVVLLRWTQVAFFVSALILLMAGFLMIKKSVVAPLRALGAMAERIGQGDFSTPVSVSGPRAVKMLGHNLDSMRNQLQTSHNEGMARTQTLETQMAQRNRELGTAFEVSQKIVTEFDLDQLLPAITNYAQALTQAQAANLCMLTPDGAHLDLAVCSGVTAEPANPRQPVNGGLAAHVIGQGQTVATEQTCANCRFLKPHPPAQGIATPLKVADNTLGALCVMRTTASPFDRDEIRALTLLANSAAIAIANARLVEAERRQTEKTATMAERERLAAEFHDNLAQTLSFLNFKADKLAEILDAQNSNEAGAELGRMKIAITEAYGQVRAALAGLREPVVEGDDLTKQLATCLDEFRERSGLTANLEITHPSRLALPRLAQQQAMLIVREALTNIRRHAQAQQVWVSVEHDALQDEARFIIKDDGCGFNPTAANGNNHLGLSIMQTRAERSGGSLTIESTPDVGTTVLARFPLTAAETTDETEFDLGINRTNGFEISLVGKENGCNGSGTYSTGG